MRYSAFEALWNSIVKAQQHVNLVARSCVVEGEQTDDDGDAEVWEDAQESLDGSLV